MVLFYTWNLKNVTCLFLIPQTSLLCEFCVLPPEKSLTLSIFLEYYHHYPVLWVKTNYFGIFPPLRPSQPMLTSFPPMSYLPWDPKGELMSLFWCLLWPLFVSFTLSSKLGGQTDTRRHYWPLVFQLLQITLCPDHTLPSELHSEPAESLSNDIQIVCLSHALGQPLLDSAPPFPNWLLLCQSLSWELSTLTAHLSSRCSDQKPSSDFICLPVLCCA